MKKYERDIIRFKFPCFISSSRSIHPPTAMDADLRISVSVDAETVLEMDACEETGEKGLLLRLLPSFLLLFSLLSASSFGAWACMGALRVCPPSLPHPFLQEIGANLDHHHRPRRRRRPTQTGLRAFSRRKTPWLCGLALARTHSLPLPRPSSRMSDAHASFMRGRSD